MTQPLEGAASGRALPQGDPGTLASPPFPLHSTTRRRVASLYPRTSTITFSHTTALKPLDQMTMASIKIRIITLLLVVDLAQVFYHREGRLSDTNLPCTCSGGGDVVSVSVPRIQAQTSREQQGLIAQGMSSPN